MTKRKIISILGLGGAVIMLAGCGVKPAADDSAVTPAPSVSQAPEKIPAATGNVDATVDAIIDEANKENDLVSGADSVAKEAINDAQETDELSKVYDENEF